MSKRRQETQGRREDASDNEVEEIDTGFKTADPSVLATRKIKGLPKRDSAMGLTSAPTMPTPPPVGSFAALSGITPPAPTMPAASTSFGGFNGGIKHNGTTSFTNFANSESFSAAPPPLTPQPTEIIEEYDPLLLKGFLGLNQTLFEIVQEQLKDDPFADISATLARYQSCRASIVDGSSKSSFTKFDLPPVWAESKPESKKRSAPKQPKPANPISDFGAPSVPTAGMFQFGPSPPSSDDNPSKKKATTSAATTFTFKPIIPTPANSNANSFTANSSKADSSNTQEPKVTPSNPFSFPTSASTSTSTSTSSPFTFNTSTSTPAKFPFTFGAGSASTAPSLPTPSGSPGGKAGSIGNPVGFTFGSPKDEKKESFSSIEVTKSGSSSIKDSFKSSGFSGFGAFNTQKEGPSASTVTKFGGSSTSENAFASPKAIFPGSGTLTPSLTPLIQSREETPLSETAATEGTTNGESATDEPQATEEDVYEGEENETTIYSIKAKVSKLVMKDEKGEWSTMGVGLIKLKRHDEKGVRRILHRDTASKRIVINSRLFKGLNVTIAGARMLKLGLIEDQKTVQYLIRVPSEQDCKDLKKHLDEQVAELE